jgi:hypothetical protein
MKKKITRQASTNEYYMNSQYFFLIIIIFTFFHSQRSNGVDSNFDWSQQQQNEIRDEQYAPDMNIFKNELNKFKKKKKQLSLELYKRRLLSADQHLEKRNNANYCE